MKTINIIFCLLISLLSLPIEAQSPILPKYNNPTFAETENAYYKDVNNFHDQYVGTWLYTSGSDTLKIKIRERTMVYVEGPLTNVYLDILVGEYLYIENGVEKVNTLENLTEEYVKNSDYNLYSYSQQSKTYYPQCDECFEGEKRLVMSINEPSRRHISGLSDDFVIRRYFDDGVEKLKVWFKRTDNGVFINDNTGEFVSLEGFSLPYGEYILTKIE